MLVWRPIQIRTESDFPSVFQTAAIRDVDADHSSLKLYIKINSELLDEEITQVAGSTPSAGALQCFSY